MHDLIFPKNSKLRVERVFFRASCTTQLTCKITDRYIDAKQLCNPRPALLFFTPTSVPLLVTALTDVPARRDVCRLELFSHLWRISEESTSVRPTTETPPSNRFTLSKKIGEPHTRKVCFGKLCCFFLNLASVFSVVLCSLVFWFETLRLRRGGRGRVNRSQKIRVFFFFSKKLLLD